MKKRLFILLVSAFAGLAAHAQFQFQGTVADENGKGISGVVVNNGVDFTTTDKAGHWSLQTDTCLSKMISISVPAAYELPDNNGIAKGFYVSTRQLCQEKSHEFTLKKRDKISNNFYLIEISDPQVKTEAHMKRWTSETVTDLHHTTDSLSKTHEVVVMTLGDLVWDNMPLMDDYASSCSELGIPVYSCMGNHDFNLKYSDLQNVPYGSPNYAERDYEEHFGPANYSLNIGKVHIITLKNINYKANRNYVEMLTPNGLEWLRKDLSYVKKGTTIIINMHAAGWNNASGKNNIRDATEFEELLKGYNAHVFAGHTHFFQNAIVSKHFMQHNIGAACGTWWNSNVNRCGAPNGYMIVEVKGGKLKWHYKPTKESLQVQMRVYNRGEFAEHPDQIVVNIWDVDSRCEVRWKQDGHDMGKMNQLRAKDPTPATNSCLTDHLFTCTPSPDAHQVTVIFTNHFGEKYEKTIRL